MWLAHWSVNFAMDDEREKSKMKETTNELANLIFSLNLNKRRNSYYRICTIGKRGNC